MNERSHERVWPYHGGAMSRQRPNADIEEGHRSLLLVHHANISCRLGGRKLHIDPQTEQILDDPEAMRFFKREYRKPWVVEEVV